MIRSWGVPFYAKRPRKAVSVFEEYGEKPDQEPIIKKVSFAPLVKARKKYKSAKVKKT